MSEAKIAGRELLAWALLVSLAVSFGAFIWQHRQSDLARERTLEESP